ncbi:hypothetical protein [Caudoviricetes sp.]|nr:hypothetical protein [Caudoviricetes sp.]UOF81032.1 hypothetical protein [Caudoviricetes sp.]UOF81386.1 hypothetical protein [Caudoviricetes sp.]
MSEVNSERDRLIIEMHSDLKHLVKNFDGHILLDDKRQQEITQKIDFHQRIVYGGIGIVVAIEFAMRLMK